MAKNAKLSKALAFSFSNVCIAIIIVAARMAQQAAAVGVAKNQRTNQNRTNQTGGMNPAA